MRTEIVIPFAFDTEPLEQAIQSHGEEEVMRALSEFVRKNVEAVMPKQLMFGRSSYNNPVRTDKDGNAIIDWKEYVDRRFDQLLEPHMQEIIDEAALLLAMRAGRKRTWREVLDEYREEQDG